MQVAREEPASLNIIPLCRAGSQASLSNIITLCYAGSEASLQCRAVSVPPGRVSWYRSGREILNSSLGTPPFSGGQLDNLAPAATIAADRELRIDN